MKKKNRLKIHELERDVLIYKDKFLEFRKLKNNLIKENRRLRTQNELLTTITADIRELNKKMMATNEALVRESK